jgi:opacity protein-like surface antigen
MKSLLLAGICCGAIMASAQAADLSAYKAPATPPYYNWSGFYLGGNLGGAWTDGSLTDNLTGTSFSADHSGLVAGAQIGFNYQIGWFVWGAEASFDRASLDTTSHDSTSPITGNSLQGYANAQDVATIAGRLGVASDRWLTYVKGGGGWVYNKASITDQTTFALASASATDSGWLVGAGIEYALTSNWTIRLEYDYLGLGGWGRATPFLPGDTFNVSHHDLQTLTIGVNYRFY